MAGRQLGRTARTWLIAIGAAVSLVALGACGAAQSSGTSSTSGTSDGARSVPAPPRAIGAAALAPEAAVPAGEAPGTGQATGSLEAGTAGSTATDGQASAATAPPSGALADRSIIRTETVTIRVTSVLQAAGRIADDAAAVGGYLSQDQTTAQPDHPGRAQAVLTLRIPSADLSAVSTRIQASGTLISESLASSDVTNEVVDTSARISSEQASVNRVQKLMSDATSLGQVLEIENALAARQAILESLQAQAKTLADETTLATLTVTVIGPKVAATKPKPVPASTTGFGHGISQGWHGFVTATGWILTGIGTVLPFLIVLVPIALVAAAFRRRTKAAAVSEPPVPA